ncbi:DUF819 family protein [Luteimonas sp. e5]
MPPGALIDNDIVVFGLIAATLGAIFWSASRPAGFWKKFYAIVPPLLLCYFIPGLYNSIGLIDGAGSKLYNPVASRVLLPAALVLLTLTVDLRAVLRLGPKLLAMYFGATLSIMAGAIIAFLVMRALMPEMMAGNTWAGMAALAGSWIGGGANMLAMKEIFDVDATTFGQFAVIDVAVGYVWMAGLIFIAGRAATIDARSGADTAALEDLKERVAAYRAQHERVPTLTDFMLIVGLAFGVVGLAHWVAGPWSSWVGQNMAWASRMGLHEPFVWIIFICTLAGLALSFTRARTLDGAGASTIGSVLLYFLIAAIGMQMEIGALLDNPGLFLLGALWLSLHVVLLWLLGRALRVPLFYFAIGSQSNVGGPASAPVVASAFHPALAPIGALLGAMGYVVGTVAAWVLGLTLRAMAG